MSLGNKLDGFIQSVYYRNRVAQMEAMPKIGGWLDQCSAWEIKYKRKYYPPFMRGTGLFKVIIGWSMRFLRRQNETQTRSTNQPICEYGRGWASD